MMVISALLAEAGSCPNWDPPPLHPHGSVSPPPLVPRGHTDKKENKTFLIYKEIQMGSGTKSYMRKGFLIYEEMRNFSPYMRRPLVIYDFAPDPSEFPYILGKFYFIFYQCTTRLRERGWGGGSNSDDGTYTVYCMCYVLSPFETEPYFSVGWGLSSTTNLR
jgi:hypothetical protein